MKLVKAMDVLAAYTADQWGLVTSAQATSVDVGSVTLLRLVDAGFLDHVRRGVYSATAAGGSSHTTESAAWLLLNPAVPAWERPKLDPDGGVVSHRSAAMLHNVGDLLAEQVEITVPRRRTTRDPDTRLRVGHLEEDDVTLVDGLPVTTVERTVVDLLAEHIDGGHAGQLIYQAIRRGQLDVDDLAARVGGYCRSYGVRGRDGRALIAYLLEQAGTDLLRALEKPAFSTAMETVLRVGQPASAATAIEQALGVSAAQGILSGVLTDRSGRFAELTKLGLGSGLLGALAGNSARTALGVALPEGMAINAVRGALGAALDRNMVARNTASLYDSVVTGSAVEVATSSLPDGGLAAAGAEHVGTGVAPWASGPAPRAAQPSDAVPDPTDGTDEEE